MSSASRPEIPPSPTTEPLLQRGLHYRRRLHREAVVLAGDLDASGEVVAHRMVDAPVSELELVRGESDGQGHELVAEADAEHRQLAQ